MTDDQHDKVMQHFSNSVLDWTPKSMQHEFTVVFVPFSNEQAVTQRCLGVLSDAETERSERFGTTTLRAQFIQRRAFQRYCAAVSLDGSQPLAELNFRKAEKGRPILCADPSKWFSFSSCKQGFAGAWSTDHALGVDVEDNSRNLDFVEMAQGYFSPKEAKSVLEAGNNTSCKLAFLNLWCLKEAALKSIGEGLPFGMDSFQFCLKPEPEIVKVPREYGNTGEYSAYLKGGSQLTAAVVVRRLS